MARASAPDTLAYNQARVGRGEGVRGTAGVLWGQRTARVVAVEQREWGGKRGGERAEDGGWLGDE